MQHYWFRLLDGRLLAQARALGRRGGVRIIASEISASARRSLGKKPLPENVFTELAVAVAVDDETGGNIRARIETLTTALSCSPANEIAEQVWLPVAMREFEAEWIRIGAAVKASALRPLCEFLAFVENTYRTGGLEAPASLIINLGGHAGVDIIVDSAAGLLRVPFPARMVGLSPNPLAAAGRQLLFLMLRLGWLTARWICRRPAPEACFPAGRDGSVLVQYEKGALERYPLGATQDWIEESGLPHRRVVFYCNRDDSPLSGALKRQLTEYGFGWVDYRRPAGHDPRAWWTLLVTIGQLLSVFPRPWNRAALHRWLVLAMWLPEVNGQRAFLRRHNILSVHQHLEFIPTQMAFNLACRCEDVAFIWTCWSIIFIQTPGGQYGFADLVFTAGPDELGFYRMTSLDYRYIVQTGLTGYDGLEADDGPRAGDLRAQLAARPRFVVAMFDSSHAARGLHHSTVQCIEFYRVTLALIRDNPDWGCLIKSKSTAYDALPRREGVQDVVERLTAEGRCLRLPVTVKPTLAALASDVTVCFSVNSAGIMSALHTGCRTLHFDPSHLTMHQLYALGGEGKIIFRDAGSFSAALQAVARGDDHYGDLSPWAYLFDPFGDGWGRKRSGKIMAAYIAHRDRGLPMAEALRHAVIEYADCYGDGLVAACFERNGGEGERSWRNIMNSHYEGWPPALPYTQAALSTEPMVNL